MSWQPAGSGLGGNPWQCDFILRHKSARQEPSQSRHERPGYSLSLALSFFSSLSSFSHSLSFLLFIPSSVVPGTLRILTLKARPVNPRSLFHSHHISLPPPTSSHQEPLQPRHERPNLWRSLSLSLSPLLLSSTIRYAPLHRRYAPQ